MTAAVECLGRRFDSEEDRQHFFAKALRDYLQPSLFGSPGFPEGEPEDILGLSDPPTYTACPNPFIEDFISIYGHPWNPAEEYHVGPYMGELEIEKRHEVYGFHPYHTKVPPEIIRTLIQHYTRPGDVVLDGFCGSGMTGVAAREVGRNAILIDLSPMATFVAGANATSHDWSAAISHLTEAIEGCQSEWGFLYETEEGRRRLPVNYYVWSDIFSCPGCATTFPFFPYGVTHFRNKVETRKNFPCPSCGLNLNVRLVQRIIHEGRKQSELVWVNAGVGQERVNRAPNRFDVELAARIKGMSPPSWFPTDPINTQGYSAKLAQLGDKRITDVSRLLSERNLIVFADLWHRLGQVQDSSIRHICRATLTSVFTVISERQGYFGGGGGMSGNMYMPIVRMEKNILDVLRRKLRKLEAAEVAKAKATGNAIVSTPSATHLSAIPARSVDYVYVDPPFGANIIYSELNLVLEAWLRVKTNEGPEAVIDVSRGREQDEYARLMLDCFREFFRVLKPGRWMTVEFHNTAAEVWNTIQTAIRDAGFSIEQIAILDKGTTTILSDIRPGAAKHDLIISAHKPGASSRRNGHSSAGAAGELWDLVTQRLLELPIPKTAEARGLAKERRDVMLFNRMVAYHVERGLDVPISAARFYTELAARFHKVDGMYFLPAQAGRYRELRELAGMQTPLIDDDVEQPELF